MKLHLAALACFALLPAEGRITLPIEVAGEAGSEASVTLDLPAGSERSVQALWMQIHGLQYADMVSVRINQSVWLPLNNETVQVEQSGKNYGGIGGGFATLKLTLALPAGSLTADRNTIRFRFNGTNGVVSGFRVLALNFVTVDGRKLLSVETFVEEDPNCWQPPSPDAESITAGRNLWYRGQLTANGLPHAPPIRAHCADCHAQDGRDLKYFNYSNISIEARSRFHGLSPAEGRQIASYIRSLRIPNPGRPWNPPYQPGPGDQSAAGAGLARVLDRDADTLAFLFPATISAAVFRPDGNLNAREIPIAFQLPDWNHWLPHVHPADAWGERFENSEFARIYLNRASADGSAVFFDKWSKARANFLSPHLAPNSKKWTSDLAEKFYAAQLWQLVKTWEITQELKLEEREAGTWPNTIPALTAPTEVNIPDGPAGMGGSGLTNEYYSNAWYQLQVLLNNGSHRHHGRLPVDWPYLAGHIQELERLSGDPEAGRLLITLIKGMQSTDPGVGPDNIAEGWRPEQNIDPRIMIDEKWSPMFAALRPEVKLALTEAMLTAWLDKTLEYEPAAYFKLGLTAGSYSAPTVLKNISGGRVFDAAPQFRAAGVRPQLVQRLEEWGKAYMVMAQLFHY